MPTGSRKSAGIVDIKQGSILLLFTDHEAEIVRDWQFGKSMATPRTTATPPNVESAPAEPLI